MYSHHRPLEGNVHLIVQFGTEHTLPVEERTEHMGDVMGSRRHRVEQGQQMRESGLLRAEDEGVVGFAGPGDSRSRSTDTNVRLAPSSVSNASSSVSPTENQGTYTRPSMACTVPDRLTNQADPHQQDHDLRLEY